MEGQESSDDDQSKSGGAGAPEKRERPNSIDHIFEIQFYAGTSCKNRFLNLAHAQMRCHK